MTQRRTIFKNAGANLVSGGAAAVLALVLPPFLVRLLPPAVFGAWALILDIAAAANLFRFGLQAAVGKYVAETVELGQPERRDSLVNTALALLAGLGVVALAVVLTVDWQFKRWFHQVPPALVPDARIALLLVGATLALGLPFSVFAGIFTGLQRFEMPAAINGLSKLALAGVLIVIARLPRPTLTKLALGWASVMLISYAAQFGVCRWLGPRIGYAARQVRLSVARQLAGYSATLTVWGVAMLMVVGLDTTLVGIFDFKAVGYYAIAAGLITLLAGFQNSILATLVPVASALSVKQDGDRQLGDLLMVSTRYDALMLVVMTLPLLLLTQPLLTFWVGASYAAQTVLLVQILVVANLIRLLSAPYAVFLVGAGLQRLVLVSPLLEGVTNLGFSLYLGYRMGAVGVALGTLAGAVVGTGANFVYNIPRTPFLASRLREYVRTGLVRPLACGLPAVIVFYVLPPGAGGGSRGIPAVLLAAAATVWCLWVIGLSASERRRCAARVAPAWHWLTLRGDNLS